jgi:hypothetical protein
MREGVGGRELLEQPAAEHFLAPSVIMTFAAGLDGSFEAEVMLSPCMTNEGTNSTALTLSLLPGISIASPSATV